MTKQVAKKTVPEETDKNTDIPVCGIIMPIANTEGYTEGHWTDVYSILSEVAENAGFNANLVSFDDDVGIIHKRIVHNIYSNPIVICDISSRNANVMLELGMRLAFDKPTIIVKDNKTPYSFDIAAIEHIEYPSDLRYQLINDFKLKLKNKIIETYKRSNNDPNFTTFLKHFGTFKVAKLEEREVTSSEYMAVELRELKDLVLNSIAMNNRVNSEVALTSRRPGYSNKIQSFNVAFGAKLPETLDFHKVSVFLKSMGMDVVSIRRHSTNASLVVEYVPTLTTPSISEISEMLNEYIFSLSD